METNQPNQPQLWTIGKSKPSLFGAFSSSTGSRANAASARHRCHISCELHDHHLNDATRLHQAMLSSAALEIGSINLADMDPDEIQVSACRLAGSCLPHQPPGASHPGGSCGGGGEEEEFPAADNRHESDDRPARTITSPRCNYSSPAGSSPEQSRAGTDPRPQPAPFSSEP